MPKRLLSLLLGLFFPPECQACGRGLSLVDSSGVCLACETSIRWMRPPHCPACGRTLKEPAFGVCGTCAERSDEKLGFNRAFACAAYQGVTRKILHRYKFGRKRALSRFLSGHMLAFARRHLKKEDFDAALSVPLDPARHAARGFNQSLLLSRHLSRALGLPEISSALSRRRGVSCQSLLTKEDRRRNVRDCFVVADPSLLRRFRRVLLVDDILTSGYTLSECAKTLKRAGTESVTALTFARGV